MAKRLRKSIIDVLTGECIAKANDEVTADLLEKCLKHGIDKLELIYTNDLDQVLIFPIPYVLTLLKINLKLWLKYIV